MKTILLSFNPAFYEPFEKGEKKYEYRSRFSDEEVKAYIYLSSPIRKIVAVVYFGKKILLETMKDVFKENPDVITRINDYMQTYNKKYAVPILKIEFVEPISLDMIREELSGFMPPQSYMIIKENTVLERILNQLKKNGQSIILDHDNIVPNDICTN